MAVLFILMGFFWKFWYSKHLIRSIFCLKLILQLAAFAFLIAALVRIYITMRDQTKMVINVREMSIHALAFALYLIAVVLITYTNNSKSGSNLLFLVTNLVWISIFLISQILLVIILNQLCI
jgi:hypothetical protein